MDASTVSLKPGRLVAATTAALLASFLLVGCSEAREQSAVGAPEDTAAGEGAAAPQAREQDSGEEDAAAAGTELDVGERTMVHTAELTVEVTEVEQAADDAKEWVGAAGGHVASESVTAETGKGPKAVLALKVPVARYEEALGELGDLGEQADLQREVEDVTEEVADVDSRVESAEATLDRLRGLLDEADDVADVLKVESEISTRQQELEALQARQEALRNSSEFGTVNLSLLPPDSYLAESKDDSVGFTGGLLRGWRALTSLARGAAVAVGWGLPFLGAASFVAVPAVLWWRRRSGKPAPAVPTGGRSESGDGEDQEIERDD